MTILVDTNVLLDIVTDDPVWSEWSYASLERSLVSDRVVINPVIYAELSVAFDRMETIDDALERIGIAITEVPREALFLAGRAFVSYRRLSGTKTGVLPDFFIGAHASVRGWALLTRDKGRYGTYFPRMDVIAP